MQEFEFFLRTQLTEEREKNLELQLQLEESQKDCSKQIRALEEDLEKQKYIAECLESVLKNNEKENKSAGDSADLGNLDLSAKIKSLSSQKILDDSKIKSLHEELILSQRTIEQLQQELSQKGYKALDRTKHKNIFKEEIFNLEEQCKVLQSKNESLLEDNKARGKRIESLETDISAMEDLYRVEEENQKLVKEKQSLKQALKLSEQNLARAKEENKELKETLDEVSYNSKRKIEFLDKEKKQLLNQIQDLSNENTELSLDINRREYNASKIKEDVKFEFQQRLLQLKQEKSELENTLKELREQLDRDFESDNSLFHELALIEVPVVNTNLEEDIIFVQDNKKVNSANRQELILMITEAENALLRSKLEFAEAATERDIYQKKYLDLKKGLRLK